MGLQPLVLGGCNNAHDLTDILLLRPGTRLGEVANLTLAPVTRRPSIGLVGKLETTERRRPIDNRKLPGLFFAGLRTLKTSLFWRGIYLFVISFFFSEIEVGESS